MSGQKTFNVGFNPSFRDMFFDMKPNNRKMLFDSLRNADFCDNIKEAFADGFRLSENDLHKMNVIFTKETPYSPNPRQSFGIYMSNVPSICEDKVSQMKDIIYSQLQDIANTTFKRSVEISDIGTSTPPSQFLQRMTESYKSSESERQDGILKKLSEVKFSKPVTNMFIAEPTSDKELSL